VRVRVNHRVPPVFSAHALDKAYQCRAVETMGICTKLTRRDAIVTPKKSSVATSNIQPHIIGKMINSHAIRHATWAFVLEPRQFQTTTSVCFSGLRKTYRPVEKMGQRTLKNVARKETPASRSASTTPPGWRACCLRYARTV